MPRLRLDISAEAYNRLSEAAAKEHRPPLWHAEFLLAQALGLAPEAETKVLPIDNLRRPSDAR